MTLRRRLEKLEARMPPKPKTAAEMSDRELLAIIRQLDDGEYQWLIELAENELEAAQHEITEAHYAAARRFEALGGWDLAQKLSE